MDFKLGKMKKEELLNLLHGVVKELRKYGNGELKKGQKVLIGTKYANHPNFKEDYDVVADEIGIYNDTGIGISHRDEEGNDVPCVQVEVRGKGRRKNYFIHPDDAIPIE